MSHERCDVDVGSAVGEVGQTASPDADIFMLATALQNWVCATYLTTAGTRSVPGGSEYGDYSAAGRSAFDGVAGDTGNLHNRYAYDLSQLASRYNSETSAFSSAFAVGFANASSHFTELYGPTAAVTSPYDTAASSAYSQYSTLADLLRAQFTAYSSAASSEISAEAASASAEFTAATSEASARYATLANQAYASFSAAVGAHTTEALYTAGASAAFYGTVSAAASAISGSALSKASSHFEHVKTEVAASYLAAMSLASSQFATALNNAEALFTEMTSAGHDSDVRARSAALAAYSTAAAEVSSAKTDLMSRAGSALTNANGYAWSMYRDAIGDSTADGRARTGFYNAAGIADAAYHDASTLAGLLGTTSYSGTAYGTPNSRQDVESAASAIAAVAFGHRGAIDDAIDDATSGIATAAANSSNDVAGAVDGQFAGISETSDSLSTLYSSGQSPTWSSMNSVWNSRSADIDGWLTGTLNPFSATSLTNSASAAALGSASVGSASSSAFANWSSYYATDVASGTAGAGSGPGALTGWPSVPTPASGSSASLAVIQDAFATWLPGLRIRVGVNPTQYLVSQPDGPDVQLFVTAAEYPAAALASQTTTYSITITDQTGTTSAGDSYTLSESIYVLLIRTVDTETGAYSVHALYLVTGITYAESHTLAHTDAWSYTQDGGTFSGSRPITEIVNFTATGAYWFDVSATGTSGASITVSSYSLDERRDLGYVFGQTGTISTGAATWTATRAADNERPGFKVTGTEDATWNNVETGTYRDWNVLTGGNYKASSSYDSGMTADHDTATVAGAYERGIWISATHATSNNFSTGHVKSTATQSQTWLHDLTGGAAATTLIDTVVDISSQTNIARNRGDDVFKYVNAGSYVLSAFRIPGVFEFGGVSASWSSTGSEVMDAIHHDTASFTQTAAASHTQNQTLTQSATVNRLASTLSAVYGTYLTASSTASSTVTASDIEHSADAFSMAEQAYLLQKTYTMLSRSNVGTSGGTYLHDSWATETFASTMGGVEGHALTQTEILNRPASAAVWQGAFSYSASVADQTGYAFSGSASSAASMSQFENAAYNRDEIHAAFLIQFTPTAVPESLTLDFRITQSRPTMTAGTLYSTVTYSGGDLYSQARDRGFTKTAFAEGDTVTISYSNEYDSVTYAQRSSESVSQSATTTASASSSGVERAKQNYSALWDYEQLGFTHFYDDQTQSVSASHARSEHATNTFSATVTANLGASQTESINGSYYQRSKSASQSHSETGSASEIQRGQQAGDAIDFGSATWSAVAGNVNIYDPFVTTKEFAFALQSNAFATDAEEPHSALPDATAANVATATHSQWNQASISSTDSSTFIDKYSQADLLSTASGGSTAKLVTLFNPLSIGVGGPVTPTAQWGIVVEKDIGVEWHTPGWAAAFAANRVAWQVGTDTAAGTWLADVSMLSTQSQTQQLSVAAGVATPIAASYGEVAYGFGVESFTASNSLTEKITPAGSNVVGNIGRAIDFGSYVSTGLGRWSVVNPNLGGGVQTESAAHTAFADSTKTAVAVQWTTDITSATASFNATSTATPAIPASTSATEVNSTGTNWKSSTATQAALQTAFATDNSTQTGYASGEIFDFAAGSAANSGFVWSTVSAHGSQINSLTQTFTSHDIGTPAYHSGTVAASATAPYDAIATNLEFAAGSELFRAIDDDIALNRGVDVATAVNYASQSTSVTAAESTVGTWSVNRTERYTATASDWNSGSHIAGGRVTGTATAYQADAARAFDLAMGSEEPTMAYLDFNRAGGGSSFANLTWISGGNTTTGGTMTEGPIVFTKLNETIAAYSSHTASEAGSNTLSRSFHNAAAENFSLAPVDFELDVGPEVSLGEDEEYTTIPESMRLVEGLYQQDHVFNQTGSYTTAPEGHPFAGSVTRELSTAFSMNSRVLASGAGSGTVVHLGNMSLGTQSQTQSATAWETRAGATVLGLTESGTFTRTVEGGETQGGSFTSVHGESHGFSYIAKGIYVSTQVSGLLGGHADWSRNQNNAELTAAGSRFGEGGSSFHVSGGQFHIGEYAVGAVGDMPLATNTATVTGSLRIDDSGGFGYMEANLDTAFATDVGDYFYGIVDASEHYATDDASQAFTWINAGASTYDKGGQKSAGSAEPAAIIGGFTGSMSLYDIVNYSESTGQVRFDYDSTLAVRIDGEHLTRGEHHAAGSILHVSTSDYIHSFHVEGSALLASGAGVAGMTFNQNAVVGYSLTDAYNYVDVQGRIDERSWSLGGTATPTASFVAHNSVKHQTGGMWQSELASYSNSLYAEWATHGVAPTARGNTLVAQPGGDAMAFGSWNGDDTLASGALGVVPSGLEGLRSGDYSDWFANQSSGYTTSGTFKASEIYTRIDDNNLYANYTRQTADFGFEDVTPSPVTVKNESLVETLTDVVRQEMDDLGVASWPHSYSRTHEAWTDKEYHTATETTGSFSISGYTQSPTASLPASISLWYSQLRNPAAEYYVTASIERTEADTVTTQTLAYTKPVDGSSMHFTAAHIFNGTVDSLYYGDVANYSRLDQSATGLWDFSRKDEKISHTFENTTASGIADTWSVTMTEARATENLTATYSGIARNMTAMSSNYYRNVDMTDIVIPTPGVDMHYTHWTESGAFIDLTYLLGDQNQTWTGGNDYGSRTGQNDNGTFDGGEFGVDGAYSDGSPYGDDYDVYAWHEVGNQRTLTIPIHWTSTDHQALVAFPAAAHANPWTQPAMAPITTLSAVETYDNTVNFDGTLYAYKTEGTPEHPHKSATVSAGHPVWDYNFSTTKGTYVTSMMAVGTVSYTQTGKSQIAVTGPISGGNESSYLSMTAVTSGAHTGTNLWYDHGSYSMAETVHMVDGTLNAYGSGWTKTGTLERSQSHAGSESSYGIRDDGLHWDMYGTVAPPPDGFTDSLNTDIGTLTTIPTTPGTPHYMYDAHWNKRTDSYNDGEVDFDSKRPYTYWPVGELATMVVGATTNERYVSATTIASQSLTEFTQQYGYDGVHPPGAHWYGRTSTSAAAHNFENEGTTSLVHWSYTSHSISQSAGPSGTPSAPDTHATASSISLAFTNAPIWPSVEQGVAAGLAAAAMNTNWHANLDVLEDHASLMDRRDDSDLFFGPFVAPKAAAQGAQYAAQAAKAKLRTDVTAQPKTREGQNNAGLNASDLQAGAQVAELFKKLTGPEADAKCGQVTGPDADVRTKSNGLNPQIIYPSKNSGDANILADGPGKSNINDPEIILADDLDEDDPTPDGYVKTKLEGVDVFVRQDKYRELEKLRKERRNAEQEAARSRIGDSVQDKVREQRASARDMAEDGTKNMANQSGNYDDVEADRDFLRRFIHSGIPLSAWMGASIAAAVGDQELVDEAIARGVTDLAIAGAFAGAGILADNAGMLISKAKRSSGLIRALKKFACFEADTPVWVASKVPAMAHAGVGGADCSDETSVSAIAIENVPLGCRLPGVNPVPEIAGTLFDESTVDEWVKIDLVYWRNDGSKLHAELLRPAGWVRQYGWLPGELVRLNYPEIDVQGWVRILNVAPFDLVAPAGEGNLCTGRLVSEDVGDLFRVRFAGVNRALCGTARHPIWSESRQTFVALGSLAVGDLVLAESGPVAVVAVEPITLPITVYNLEINDNHVYLVTEAGILVHNADGFDCDRFIDLLTKESEGLLNNPAERKQLGELLVQLRSENWTKYLESKIGANTSTFMMRVHAHHILFKLGLGRAQRKLVVEGMAILRKYGIDPIHGIENLVWAPNVTGIHSIENLKHVVDRLREADRRGKKSAIVKALKELGEEARNWGKDL